jgi:(p)ppGpp synthase/HD superfamily hydrolase
MTQFVKLRQKIRNYLVLNNMPTALDAMQFALGFHQGLRKNGKHEFSHQLEMAEMIINLHCVDDLESVLAVCFLHDVREDYDVEDAILRNRFGCIIADAVEFLTKEFKGVKKTTTDPFASISANRIASVVKGIDRNHNLRTMDGAFSPAKQDGYRAETIEQIIPMLRRAYVRHKASQPALASIISRLSALSMPAPHAY